MLFADLHIHSKYSRATSPTMNIKNLSHFGKMKGLNVIGTGDILHPKWQEEVKRDIDYLGNGIFKSKFNDMRFMLSTEIATIYGTPKGVKRIHHVLMFQDFDSVDNFIDRLRPFLLNKGKKCNLISDGRPIVGLTSVELAEILFESNKNNMLIPAHIWTPWFGLFGTMSGYDKIEECYGKYSKNIFSVETGLSSDPPMNHKIENIKDYSLVSNSDCHGPDVDRIGRECNAFNYSTEEFNYNILRKSLKNNDIAFTVEVDPSYGKYHFDGHRKCNICFKPNESILNNNICPVCQKRLTIGVLHRSEELSKNSENFKSKNKVPFEYHIPLIEIISNLVGKGVKTKTVRPIYDNLIKKYGNEFNIMFNISIKELNSSFTNLGNIINQLRNKTLKVLPGYDGVYGKPIIQKMDNYKLSNF